MAIGWYLTVFVFYALFALYARKKQARNIGYWPQALLAYLALASQPLLSFLVSPEIGGFADVTGKIWQAEDIKKALETATADFKKGLVFNKIHYKCLVGLYELMMKKKQYGEAYQVVKRVAALLNASDPFSKAILDKIQAAGKTIGMMSKLRSAAVPLRPPARKPSASHSRNIALRRAEKKTGIQPSAISAASPTFLGPTAAR